ncbi:MAG TPA: RloB family protein, partial [Candidatus Eisenbacteria bacterium]|nr:RloB family protein [Candidatus Eisenbacteria bacterium]
MWRIDMARSRKHRSRNTGTRRYKKVFNLICEGSKTEPEYFDWLKQQINENEIRFNITRKKPGQSSPIELIKQAERIDTRYLKDDKVWIVMDLDKWTDEHFQKISKWSKKHERNHVAVSNP